MTPLWNLQVGRHLRQCALYALVFTDVRVWAAVPAALLRAMESGPFLQGQCQSACGTSPCYCTLICLSVLETTVPCTILKAPAGLLQSCLVS